MSKDGRQPGPPQAAGWYVDPKDDDQYLYWDGKAWTGQRHPIVAGKEPSPRWFAPVMGGAVVVIVLLIAAIVVGA